MTSCIGLPNGVHMLCYQRWVELETRKDGAHQSCKSRTWLFSHELKKLQVETPMIANSDGRAIHTHVYSFSDRSWGTNSAIIADAWVKPFHTGGPRLEPIGHGTKQTNRCVHPSANNVSVQMSESEVEVVMLRNKAQTFVCNVSTQARDGRYHGKQKKNVNTWGRFGLQTPTSFRLHMPYHHDAMWMRMRCGPIGNTRVVGIDRVS